MKNTILILLFSLACSTLAAQEFTTATTPMEQTAIIAPDSLSTDTTVVEVVKIPWRPIREVLPETDTLTGASVRLIEHGTAEWAVREFAASVDSLPKVNGYRVRIFSDKRQNAKTSAIEAQTLFDENYSVPSYLVYENPYFLVTCGNCAQWRGIFFACPKLKYTSETFLSSCEIPLNEL